MGRQIKAIYNKAETSFNNPEHQKKWQGGIGILVMVVFVLSSVLLNETIQAANKAAGSYGYRSGSYGYSASTTSSDALTKPPTSVSSSVTTSSATLTVVTATQTTSSTTIDNPAYVYVHYAASGTFTTSSTACNGGSTASSAWATAGETLTFTLSSLSANTTYTGVTCSDDTNGNRSDYLGTTAGVRYFTFTTSANSGGTGLGTVTTVTSNPIIPTVVPTNAPVVGQPPVAAAIAQDVDRLIGALNALGLGVTRNVAAETSAGKFLAASVKEFGLKLSADVQSAAANFGAYGISAATMKLGSGERIAVLRDLLDTLGSAANNSEKLLQAAANISNGEKPGVRNLTKENQQLALVLKTFQKLTGKAKPDSKNAKEDLAWNTLMYRIRFPRDLNKERAGIKKFRSINFERTPKTPFDWAAVRVAGYVL